MGSLVRDLHYSYRMLLQNPGFAAVALLSLALGIGANTTIFSVLNTVLLRPFPVMEPERLAVLNERNLQKEGMRVPTFTAYQELKKRTRVFESLALTGMSGGAPGTLTSAKDAVRVQYGSVSADFFSLTGVAPVLGRTFLPEDSPPGHGTTLLLSHDFWQRQYGGDRNIIGQTVAVEGIKMTIVGVMPPDFRWPPASCSAR